MRLSGPAGILATVVVLMCMVAAITGFVFMKLSEDTSSPEYVVDHVTKNGSEIGFEGTVEYTEYDESSLESVMVFSFDVETEHGIRLMRDVTVMVDNDTLMPFGFSPSGAGIVSGVECDGWSSDDGISVLIGTDGSIFSITVIIDNITVSAMRSQISP